MASTPGECGIVESFRGEEAFAYLLERRSLGIRARSYSLPFLKQIY